MYVYIHTYVYNSEMTTCAASRNALPSPSPPTSCRSLTGLAGGEEKEERMGSLGRCWQTITVQFFEVL
jgi:hypothetical protein